MSFLDKLTEDLLIRVYNRVDSDSDRKTWRIVCKDFHRVDSLTRTSLRVLRVEFLQSLLAKFPRIETLDLSVCPRIDDGTVSLLLSRNPSSTSRSSIFPKICGGTTSLSSASIRDPLSWTLRLRKLVLSRATGLRYSGLKSLVRACPYLESVDVSDCAEFGDREAAAISGCSGLKELRLDKCVGVSDVGLAQIAVGCSKLEKLSLKWCLEIGDLGVDLLCKKCLELKSLDLSYLKVTNGSLHSISSLKYLEVLALAGCTLVDDNGLTFLGVGCPLLKMVDVSRCDGITSLGLVSLAKGHNNLVQLNARHRIMDCSSSFLCELDLKNLSTIRLDGARLSESSFKTFGESYKNLVEIGLSKCTEVTSNGIVQLVRSCADLKILDLTCCNVITDAAIFAVADSCRSLSCLKLESCDMITEKSLYYIGSFCQQLKELDLTDCTGVNDSGLEHLSRCSKLVQLKLGLCTNISDKGLCYIASNCGMITELDLYRCTGIGDDGLAGLSKGCRKIKILNLSYCVNVTDKGIACIGHLKELSDLDMRGLLKITSVGFEALAAGCKRLADLDMKFCKNINNSGFWALAYHSRNLRQINLSHCSVSDVGLCLMMGNLTCLQVVRLLHLDKVTAEGYELALRACCLRLKKVKLPASLMYNLSSHVLDTLDTRGCKIKWF